MDPEQQQTDVDQVIALGHQRFNLRYPDEGQRVRNACKQKEGNEQQDAVPRFAAVHDKSPFQSDIQSDAERVALSPRAEQEEPVIVPFTDCHVSGSIQFITGSTSLQGAA